jgi:hypothetical protein
MKKLVDDVVEFMLSSKNEDDCYIHGIVDRFLLENKFQNNESLYEEDDYKTRDKIIENIITSITEGLKNIK